MAIPPWPRKTENVGALLQELADSAEKIDQLVIENARLRQTIQEALDKFAMDDAETVHDILKDALYTEVRG